MFLWTTTMPPSFTKFNNIQTHSLRCCWVCNDAVQKPTKNSCELLLDLQRDVIKCNQLNQFTILVEINLFVVFFVMFTVLLLSFSNVSSDSNLDELSVFVQGVDDTKPLSICSRRSAFKINVVQICCKASIDQKFCNLLRVCKKDVLYVWIGSKCCWFDEEGILITTFTKDVWVVTSVTIQQLRCMEGITMVRSG